MQMYRKTGLPMLGDLQLPRAHPTHRDHFASPFDKVHDPHSGDRVTRVIFVDDNRQRRCPLPSRRSSSMAKCGQSTAYADPKIDLSCRRITVAKHTTALTGAAVVFMVSLSNGSAGAGSVQQRWACERDAFVFCSNEIPDVDRITACMVKNLKRLSAPCRAQFRRPTKVPERASGGRDNV
jgi:hypothetical protein